KLLFASVQARVTPHGANGPPTVHGIRSVGFAFAQLFEMPMPPRYFVALNFPAVLPLPNTSYARPILGVMSLYASTPGVLGITSATGWNRDGPSVCSGYQLAE